MVEGLAPRWRCSKGKRVSLAGIELVRPPFPHRFGNSITRSHLYTAPTVLVLEFPLFGRSCSRTPADGDIDFGHRTSSLRWRYPRPDSHELISLAYSWRMEEIRFVTCCVALPRTFVLSFPFGPCSSVIRYPFGGQPSSKRTVFLVSVAIWPTVPFLVPVLASTTSIRFKMIPQIVESTQKPFSVRFHFRRPGAF